MFLNRDGGWLRRRYETGPEPSSVVIGDLNGDGNPDLATVNREFLTDTASVLANKGDGSFLTEARLSDRAKSRIARHRRPERGRPVGSCDRQRRSKNGLGLPQ